MQETQQGTNISNTPKTGNTKFTLLLVVIIGIGFLGLGVFLGYNLRSSIEVEPTPTPTAVVTPTTAASGSITPTVEETSGEEVVGDTELIEYVIADCNIRIKAPSNVFPGKRGDLSSCGSFRTDERDSFSNFDTYNGSMVFFAPYLYQKDSASILAFNEQNPDTYLSRLESDPADLREGQDLLLGEIETKQIGGKEVKIAYIDRDKLGKTYNIFYTSLGKQYVIVYGGMKLSSEMPIIESILSTIEFQEPL